MARGLVISVALAALAAAPGFGQVKQKKRELAHIQSELRRAKAELERLRQSEKDIKGAVSRLENLDATSQRRLKAIKYDIDRASARSVDLKQRLDAASKVEDLWTAALGAEAARAVIERSARSDFYGRGEIWGEELRRAAILEKAGHLRGLKGFRDKTREAEAKIALQAANLSETAVRAQVEREGRLKEYESKKAELESTQERMAAAARRAKELEESATALTSLIEKLGKMPRGRRTAGPPASLDAPRHSFDWPADGRVVAQFGRERDPDLGTWIVRQGLMIETAPAAAVTAVAPGRVIFAGDFRSYGQVVIVDHGSNFYTVYGKLGAIAKSKGDPVQAGESLAEAGPTGTDATRGVVYFEMRKGVEAVNPAIWLRKK